MSISAPSSSTSLLPQGPSPRATIGDRFREQEERMVSQGKNCRRLANLISGIQFVAGIFFLRDFINLDEEASCEKPWVVIGGGLAVSTSLLSSFNFCCLNHQKNLKYISNSESVILTAFTGLSFLVSSCNSSFFTSGEGVFSATAGGLTLCRVSYLQYLTSARRLVYGRESNDREIDI